MYQVLENMQKITNRFKNISVLKKNQKKGFTLLELLIVVAIVIIVVAVSVSQFSQNREYQIIKGSTQNVFSSLDKARTDTLASLNAGDCSTCGNYSVHFQPDKAIIFQGTSAYSASTSNVIETINIISPAYISNVSWTGSNSGDIYFTRLTGLPNTSGTITLRTTNYFETITISSTGLAQSSSPVALNNGAMPAPPVLGTYTTSRYSTSNTTTFYHNVTSGSSMLLLEISAHAYSSGSYCGSTVSAPTYNSVSMSRIAGPNWAGSSANGMCQEFWYLLSPPSGSHPLTININSSQEAIEAATAINFSNVNQTNPFGAPVTSTNTWGNSINASVSTSSTDLVVDTLTTTNDYNYYSWPTGSGQSEFWSVDPSESDKGSYGSYTVGASGNTTMKWARSNSGVMLITALPIHGM